MKKPESTLLFSLFVLMLLVPALAGLAGVRESAFENRALSERPAFAAEHLLDREWYTSMSAWIDDRLPLRAQAVAADATTDLRWFHDSPDPQVWLGEGDWLWLDDGLRGACVGEDGVEDLLAAMDRIGGLVRESGRGFRWMIVPNKIALYPEHAPEGVRRAAACGEARRARLFAAMQSDGTPPGLINLHSAFGAAKRRFEHLLFYPDDSHVSDFGSALIVQQLLASLDPASWDPQALRPGQPRSRTGDLARMLVVREPLRVESWALIRTGVEFGPTRATPVGPGVELMEFTSTGPGLVEGPVFVLHDSQLNTAMAMLRTGLAHSRFLRWQAFEPELVAREMAAAETVVIEIVERDFYWRVARYIGTREFHAALQSALTRQPGAD